MLVDGEPGIVTWPIGAPEPMSIELPPSLLDPSGRPLMQTITVGPHDKLVLCFDPEWADEAWLHEQKLTLEQAGFAGRVLMVSGVQQLAVIRAERPDE